MKIEKVLFVVTSHDELGNTGKKTGLWIEEFAAPYYKFHDLGKEIVIASPKGGQAPIDPKSDLPENQTEATKRYYSDKETQGKLSNTVLLSSVSESDFDTVFYPGGHGPMWDLPDNKDSIKLIESFYNNGKPVALVCHAPVALKNVKTPDGEWLVKGKKVAAFTNSEEEAVELTTVVPFLLEDMLIERGANFQKGENWKPFVTQEGLLITGQNPASSVLAADTLLKYAEELVEKEV
ncbi:type 1 glutamine amidotransferase domain-containing protein [Chitinophaga sp. S165]|uniref:type 1 glutamine amidotransferase domain-containing protein n=1 Tax=Chitinophaga sp. S165 TaxID=2135462 RepID=UPI000D70E6DA|nr:type 1 glutamine amidotransferase domain-containing protein [Chitinophaga sp. S165]PWV56855.1 putative intracellular protease/amidase [Chitinophaga sp. S165]